MIKYLFFILIISKSLLSQDTIHIKNKSFEGIPARGISNVGFLLKDWNNEGERNFINESVPDIHPNDFWGVSKMPDDGDTYVGLVVRDNNTYESISQKLSSKLESFTCYRFYISLAKNRRYMSHSRITNIEENFIKPAILRVLGAGTTNTDIELLTETEIIDHETWEVYDIRIKPSKYITKIILEVYYEENTLDPYCGHVLIDNMSDIYKLKCGD